eukprot:365139-Chlamydomonas_euryale.AAC.12
MEGYILVGTGREGSSEFPAARCAIPAAEFDNVTQRQPRGSAMLPARRGDLASALNDAKRAPSTRRGDGRRRCTSHQPIVWARI